MNLAAPYGFNISFIGILFAVLGAGCQVSDFSKNERVSMCRLYSKFFSCMHVKFYFADISKVSCAYQCLRNGNFLSRPNMESIQTLLIIGDVLSYNMNPGIAYVTFGTLTTMIESHLSPCTCAKRYRCRSTDGFNSRSSCGVFYIEKA